MRKRKRIKQLVFLAVILILALVMLYSGLRILESTVLYQGQAGEAVPATKTIVRGGVPYFPRQDITTVLIMGIDREGPVAHSDNYTNKGASDLNMIVIFDETNKVCDLLNLNRDTMLEMPVLGIGGKQAGTLFGQLALAHTYGSGLDDSCRNTVQAISDFLHGIQIDYYVAMNMDTVAILNDSVGGVTVEVTEDFSHVDPTIGRGVVTLKGDQALNYVRTRKGLGDQLNLSRIERHEKYMSAFLSAFRAKYESDPGVVLRTYEEVLPYLVTNCSANAISGMMDRFSDYEIREVVSPEGKNVMGEEYYEFYPDEEKLDELILRLFYAPKK